MQCRVVRYIGLAGYEFIDQFPIHQLSITYPCPAYIVVYLYAPRIMIAVGCVISVYGYFSYVYLNIVWLILLHQKVGVTTAQVGYICQFDRQRAMIYKVRSFMWRKG